MTNYVITITEISQPCKITLERITEVPDDMTTLPQEGHKISEYIRIQLNASVTLKATLSFQYHQEELAAEQLAFDTLQIYHWEQEWRELSSQINSTTKTVTAEPTQLNAYWILTAQRQENILTWIWMPFVIIVILLTFVAWQYQK